MDFAEYIKESKKELKRMREEGEIMNFADVRGYVGKFTGKMVKPVDELYETENFKKGDEVFIFHKEDYMKYRKGTELDWDFVLGMIDWIRKN